MDKLIINFTPTGMIPEKAQTPHVPVAVSEIIADVREACRAGITMVHLHARDPLTQQPTPERRIYAEIIAGIRAFAPDLVICVSTSGRTVNEFEKRADVLALDGDLKPDMASLTLSSLNFNAQACINEPAVIMRLAESMLERGIKPELEAFDSGMINYARYLIRKGMLRPPHYFNLIFGNIACAQPDLLHIGVMLRDLPEDSVCSLGGVGHAQLPVNSLAIACGYGVRIGIEDNIWYDSGRTQLATNADLAGRIHALAEVNQRPVCTPAELRVMLGLKPGFGDYGTEAIAVDRARGGTADEHR